MRERAEKELSGLLGAGEHAVGRVSDWLEKVRANFAVRKKDG
jgi:hypothetical protein